MQNILFKFVYMILLMMWTKSQQSEQQVSPTIHRSVTRPGLVPLQPADYSCSAHLHQLWDLLLLITQPLNLRPALAPSSVSFGNYSQTSLTLYTLFKLD